MRQAVLQSVRHLISRVFRVDRRHVDAQTNLKRDLGADSLDKVEVAMKLEEEFDINIPDDAAEKIQTVGQAIDYIAQNKSG